MKLSSILALTAIASTSALISCAGPSGYNYQNVHISLSFNPICSGVCINGNVFTPVPQPMNPGDMVGPSGAIEMPVGGGSGSCIQITANITNAPPNFTWTIYPTPTPSVPSQPSGTTYPPGEPGVNTGSLSSTTGSQNYYCMPNAIPIYSGATLAQAQSLGIQQGETEVIISAPADPNNPSNVVSTTEYFTSQISSPPSQSGATMLVGITPNTAVTIPLGTRYQFSGYVVGDNGYYTPPGSTTVIPAQAQLWYVTGANGIPVGGGSASLGTISNTGLYIAPATYPPAATGTGTVKTVTITMASAAFPSIVTGGVGQGPATVVTFP